MEALGKEEPRHKGELRRSLGAGRRSAPLGSTRGGDGASQQCLWPGPASSFLLRSPPPPPPPQPAFCLLGTCPSSETRGVLGETKILLPPLTGLEGPVPGALQARHPQPLPPGKLGEDMVWGPASSLISSSSSLSRGLKVKVPSPQQLFCRVAPVGRTSVSRVDLPPLE